MTRVGGIDMSLSSTGVCVINIAGPDTTVALASYKSNPVRSKKDAALQPITLAETAGRLRKIRNAVVDDVRNCDLVLIEAPLYSSVSGGSQHDRSWLWGQIVSSLVHLGVPVAQVVNSTVKKFAADSGKADKTAVAAALTRLWPAQYAQPYGDDEFDALAIATMAGVKVAGRELPILVLERHRNALSVIVWPDEFA